MVSSFLLKNKQKHQSNLFLIAFLIIVGVQLTFKIINKIWLFDNVLLFYALSYYLPFLVAPLFYFFIRVRSEGTLFQTRDFVHFLPFGFGIAHQTFFVLLGEDYWSLFASWSFDAVPRAGVQLLILVIYSFLSFRCIRDFTKGSIKSGLTQFLWIVFVCESLIIVALAVMVDHYSDSFPDVRLLFVTLTFLIYWVSYKLLSHPDLLVYQAAPPSVELKIEKTAKYLNSGLKSEDADHMVTLLDKSMRDEKVFLNPELTIDTLASTLGISRHHLSQVLNERFNQSYYEYISRFRLEEAKGRLTDKRFSHYAIAAIAFDSGFSSLSNFNDLFKKRFDVTPSKFREAHAKKMMA